MEVCLIKSALILFTKCLRMMFHAITKTIDMAGALSHELLFHMPLQLFFIVLIADCVVFDFFAVDVGNRIENSLMHVSSIKLFI